MSYIVYVSNADPVKKIEPLGIYNDISKAREILHSHYSKKYLNNEHEIKVIGEDDVAIMKIDRGWISNTGTPICYYRITKCGSTGLISEGTYSTPVLSHNFTLDTESTKEFPRFVVNLEELLSAKEALKKID